MKSFDVLVIGSGPAGSTAAMMLARSGFTVGVIEKEKLPRYKVCGGGLVLRARQQLPDLPDDVIEKEFSKIDWGIASQNMRFTIEREYPVITMVMRDKLDHFLLSHAKEHGAEIIDQTRLTGLSFNGRIEATFGTKTRMITKHLIGADGALGTSARFAGILDDRYLIPALEAEIQPGNLEQYQHARFDVDAIPKGYGWVFPKRSHLSIGIASAQRGRINLKAAFKDYLAYLRVEQTSKARIYGFGVIAVKVT